MLAAVIGTLFSAGLIRFQNIHTDCWLTNVALMDRKHSKMIWGKIVRLWKAGMPARVISCYTGASISTVYRWIRRSQWKSVNTKDAHRKQGVQRKDLPNVTCLILPSIFPHDTSLPVINPTQVLHDQTFSGFSQSKSFHNLHGKPQSNLSSVKMQDVLPSANSLHGLLTLRLHSRNAVQHPLPLFHSSHYLHSING